MPLTPLRLHQAAIALLLACALALAWCLTQPALTGPFLFDDFPNLENLREIGGQFSSQRLANYLASFTGTPGRPLAALSFLVDDYAWPSDPYPFKRHNLLLHLLCGVMVFGFARTMALVRHARPVSNWIALGVASAWLLHPMQLSTSMLTVQRMTQLMTLASLATCWLVAHRLLHSPFTRLEACKLVALTGVMTVVAFLCKENGALLPLFVLLTSSWVLHHRDNVPKDLLRVYQAVLLIPIAAIVVMLLYMAITTSSNGIRDFNPWERLMTQARIIWTYLSQILLPRINGSGLFHDDIAVSRGLLSPVTTSIGIIATCTSILMAWRWRKRLPILAFAVFWYLGGHLLESTTLPLELYFEHRNYLPMVGVFLAIGLAMPLIPFPDIRPISRFAVLGWLMMTAAMTFVSARSWSSQHMLAATWATEHPNSVRAIEFLAKDLVDSGEMARARRELLQAIDRDPRVFGALATHVLLLDCQTGALREQQFQWAAEHLRGTPFNRSSLHAMSMIREMTEDKTCALPGSWDGLSLLIRALIGHPAYQNNDVQSYLQLELARNALAAGDYDLAIKSLQKAYRHSPKPRLARNIASLLSEGNYTSEALRWKKLAESMPAEWPVSWWALYDKARKQ